MVCSKLSWEKSFRRVGHVSTSAESWTHKSYGMFELKYDSRWVGTFKNQAIQDGFHKTSSKQLHMNGAKVWCGNSQPESIFSPSEQNSIIFLHKIIETLVSVEPAAFSSGQMDEPITTLLTRAYLPNSLLTWLLNLVCWTEADNWSKGFYHH